VVKHKLDGNCYSVRPKNKQKHVWLKEMSLNCQTHGDNDIILCNIWDHI